jgi:succinylglutamate desuccinylase
MAETSNISRHPEISGVQCITAAGAAMDPSAWPRPFVGIVGSLHGNEPCGRVAIDDLAAQVESGTIALTSGTLFLIHGNFEASAEGCRFTKGGTDLNRLFDYHFVDNLPEKRWASEHRRALELRPLLSSLDAALDIHSATSPTAPFAIVSRVPGSRDLAHQLGLPYITHGWEGPGLLGDRVLLQVLNLRSKPSIAVECGQHDDPSSVDRAHETVARFLAALDMLSPDQTPPPREEPSIELVLVDAIKKPSQGFEFEAPLVGLQRITEGVLVGADENLEIRCKRSCFVIMPNASVDVGNDMLYLAHTIDSAD